MFFFTRYWFFKRHSNASRKLVYVYVFILYFVLTRGVVCHEFIHAPADVLLLPRTVHASDGFETSNSQTYDMNNNDTIIISVIVCFFFPSEYHIIRSRAHARASRTFLDAKPISGDE